MQDLQVGQAGTRERLSSTRNLVADQSSPRTIRSLGLGAAAFGALAFGPLRSVRSPSDVSPLAHLP